MKTHAQNDKTNGSIELLQPYTLLQFVTIILGVSSHDGICQGQIFLLSRNFITRRCAVVSLGTFFSRKTLLNVSLIAAKDSNAKLCLRINIFSAFKYTIFAPVRLSSNWREQRHSN